MSLFSEILAGMEDKNLALLEAIRLGTKENVASLLDAGADIHYQDDLPLYIAVQNKKRDIIELLISRGANISAKNSRCLYYILADEHQEYTYDNLDLFIEANADVNTRVAMAALSVILPVETVVAILTRYEGINDGNGRLLQDAAENGVYDEVDLLLSSGANVGLQEALETVEGMLDNNSFPPEHGNQQYIAVEALLRSKLGLEARERIEIPPISEDIVFEANEDEETEQDRENRLARIRIAREMEEKNEERRRAFVEEYKNAERKEDSSSGSQSPRSTCSNESNLYGDPINEDEIIVFLIAGKETGECLSKEEISAIMESTQQMALWNGPPSGVILSQDVQPGRRRENSSVYKLPWSGIWVEGKVLKKALEIKEKSIIILEGERASIGSFFGLSRLHGQWGGEWGYVLRGNNQVAVKVETGDFQPDERYVVYKAKEIM